MISYGGVALEVKADTYRGTPARLPPQIEKNNEGTPVPDGQEKAAKNRPARRAEERTTRRTGPIRNSATAGHEAADTRTVTEGDDTQVAPNVHTGRTTTSAWAVFPLLRTM